MARPQKHTVDYFSHDADASEGHTISILINHFGHEGNSAWWLLLERISKTNNHVISIRNPDELEYLAAKMHFKPDRLKEILTKMADLEAIDQALFKAGIIWSQNFVDRLEDVYKARKQPLPGKPSLSGLIIGLSGKETGLSVPETPQSKVKETKVNNIKENSPSVENGNDTDSLPAEAISETTHGENLSDIAEPDAQAHWDKALAELEKEVSKANFHTWFAKTTGFSFQNGVFVIKTPNSFIAEYLEKNQRSLVSRVLTGILECDVRVLFSW